MLNNATLKCAEVTQRFDHLIHFVSLQKRSILIGILVLKRDSLSPKIGVMVKAKGGINKLLVSRTAEVDVFKLISIFCRFGEGYIITVRVQGDLPDMEPLYRFFSEKFPRASLKVGLDKYWISLHIFLEFHVAYTKQHQSFEHHFYLAFDMVRSLTLVNKRMW